MGEEFSVSQAELQGRSRNAALFDVRRAGVFEQSKQLFPMGSRFRLGGRHGLVFRLLGGLRRDVLGIACEPVGHRMDRHAWTAGYGEHRDRAPPRSFKE